MNIISKAKKIFTATAGTPVTAPKVPMASMPNTKAIKPFNVTNNSENRVINLIKFIFSKAYRFGKACIHWLEKIFYISVALVVLAHFVPELREMLLPVYLLIDILMAKISYLANVFLEIIG